LGHALQHQGRFEEALVRLKQGHQLGSKRPKWRYSSAQWVRHAERLLLLDGKLPAILRGQARPADAEEQLDLAELCRLKKRYAAATRFAADAFVVRPALADDHRYDAACDAARAGRGQGQDAVGLSDAEKARLRRQAREWLGAELDLRATQLIRDRRAVEGAPGWRTPTWTGCATRPPWPNSPKGSGGSGAVCGSRSSDSWGRTASSGAAPGFRQDARGAPRNGSTASDRACGRRIR